MSYNVSLLSVGGWGAFRFTALILDRLTTVRFRYPQKGLMSVKITIGYTLVQLSLASLVDRTVYQRRSFEVSLHPLELQKAEESSDG